MSIDALGNSSIVLVNEKNNWDIKDVLHDLNEIDNNNNVVALRMKISLCLCGDIKFLFFMLGREGFNKDHCLLCNLAKAKMKTFHQIPLDDEGRNELIFWTNDSTCT